MIKIQWAGIRDTNKIFNLTKRVYHDRLSANLFAIGECIKFGYVFVARKGDGKLAGAILAWRTRDDEVYVSDIVIDKEYRKQGLASQLYERILSQARDREIIAFVDHDDTPSLKLHQKLGFYKEKKMKAPYGLKSMKEMYLMRRRTESEE
jgi:ribosomal-protein-alanine N-acetyltransferase